MNSDKNRQKVITLPKFYAFAAVFIVFTIVLAGTASAKSLYVIANINAGPTPVQAYDIQLAPTYLAYQAEYGVPYHGWGGVGLAIDTDSEMLFVTYESSNTIQLVNATTMADEGSTIAIGASNLAGIVVDQDKQQVYTIDRYTPNLYVYDWDPITKTLTLLPGFPMVLPNSTGLYGIALDETNDIFYVADGDGNAVRYYDTGTWSEQGSFSMSHSPIGIAVDANSQLLYTVAGYFNSNLLSQYDLASGTETTVDMGHGGMDVAVDYATGLIYVTGGYSGDDLSVWDPTTLSQLYTTGVIGNPTGITIPGKEISYNPLNLNKVDDVSTCINSGDTITYTISYANGNPSDVTNVTITDTMPAEVTFVSSTGGGSQSGNIVTWNIGTVTTGASGSVTLTVQVNPSTPAGTLIVNYAKIDSDQTPSTTQSETTVTCTKQVISCDSLGNPKDQFASGESVYVKGSGLEPSTEYRLWIQRDPVNEGQVLNVSEDPSGVHELVTTNASGNFEPVMMWEIPSYATPTFDIFDIVADKQGDGGNTGYYNAASDIIDSSIGVAGFTAPVPELITSIQLSVGLLALVGYVGLRKKKYT